MQSGPVGACKEGMSGVTAGLNSHGLKHGAKHGWHDTRRWAYTILGDVGAETPPAGRAYARAAPSAGGGRVQLSSPPSPDPCDGIATV